MHIRYRIREMLYIFYRRRNCKIKNMRSIDENISWKKRIGMLLIILGMVLIFTQCTRVVHSSKKTSRNQVTNLVDYSYKDRTVLTRR